MAKKHNTQSATGLPMINRTTLVELIRLARISDRPLLIYGAPGIAKSETVREVYAQDGYEMVDVRVGNIPPEDMAGIAWPDQSTKRVERYMPDVVAACWKAHEKAGRPVVLFLDEINHAVAAAQGPLYSLVLERQAAGYSLPPNTAIVAAGNPEGTGSISEEMSRALLDRFWVVEYEGPTSEEFDAYAATSGIHPAIRAFLQDRPSELNAFEPDNIVSPTPRSWRKLSDVLHRATSAEGVLSLSAAIQAAYGHIGVSLGQQFTQFLEMWQDLPSLRDIISGPQEAKLPANFNGQYMVAMTLASTLNYYWQMNNGAACVAKDEETRDKTRNMHIAIMTYVQRLNTETAATMLNELMLIGSGKEATATRSGVAVAVMVQRLLSDYERQDSNAAKLCLALKSRLIKMAEKVAAIKG